MSKTDSDVQNKSSVKKKGSMKWLIAASCSVLLVVCCCVFVAAGIIYVKRDAISERVKLDIDYGTESLITESVISNKAGAVTAKSPDNPAKEIKIQYDDNYVDADESISISYRPVENLNIPEEFNIISQLIVLSRETGDVLFPHPVAVTIPYDTDKVVYGDFISVYQIMDESGTIEETTVTEINENEGTITFLTTHFSWYIVLELEKTVEEILTSNVDSGFVPKKDGWFITNRGSYITDGGNCMGMSMMAKYYYENQKSNYGDFYNKFIENDPKNELDDEIAQELAARAQLGMGDRWSSLQKDTTRFGHNEWTDADLHGKALLMNLHVTKQPQLIGLYTLYTVTKADGSKEYKWGDGGHMAMVYKYEDGKFYVYDPNVPHRGDNPGAATGRTFSYTYGSGFGLYKSAQCADCPGRQYNAISHIGTNLTTETTILANLFNKALGGFSDADFPDITFDSPEQGATISDKSVIVSGYISGGEYETKAGEKYLHWYYQNEKGGAEYLKSQVGADGYFQQELPIVPGENGIAVLAAGANPYDEWAGYGTLFIEGAIKAADMVVSLKWDRAQSDIDLHVTDPLGNHVYYINMNAPTGANLDVDNTSGYGPEHYTISSEEGDEMPFGNYKVQVHYYADHDGDYSTDQVVPYTVTIKWVKYILPDTQEKVWETVVQSGVLTSAGQMQDVYTLNYEELDVTGYTVDPILNQ